MTTAAQRSTALERLGSDRGRSLARSPGMMFVISALAAMLLSSGCSSSTAPDPIPSEVVGSYVLVAVTGHPVPFCPLGEPYGCISSGALTLGEDGGSEWHVDLGRHARSTKRVTYTVVPRPDGYDLHFRPPGERTGPPLWEGVYVAGAVEMGRILEGYGRLDLFPLRFERE